MQSSVDAAALSRSEVIVFVFDVLCVHFSCSCIRANRHWTVFVSVFRVQLWSMSIKLKSDRGSFHLPFTILVHYWSEQQYLGLEGGPPNLKQEKFRFTHCTSYQDETQPPLCLLVTVRPPMNSRWFLLPGHIANKWTCKYLESTCVSRVQQHRQYLTIQTQSFCVQ